jgi:lysophospholipid acyltransferase (LPLAT)-like uncharacterized protein
MGSRLIPSTLKTVVGGVLAAAIIRVLGATIRWERVYLGEVGSGPAVPPCIFAFWHGRMLMLPRQYRRVRGRRTRGLHMLISRHGDGRLIALAVRLLGINSVAGSSTRGGSRAFLELIRCIQTGADVGITPDGPKGPRYECKEGVVALAQKTGVPIYPVSYSTTRKWQLRSWDGMIIPKPFSRGVLIIGEPILVGSESDTGEARRKVQEALHEITERADRHWSAR